MNNYSDIYRMFVFAKEKINYFKGEIMPFIHFNCRKNLTAGDIDCFTWDFEKKIFRLIEAKKNGEKQRESQNKLLKFLQENVTIKNYDFEVYKIIGDSPFDECEIYSFKLNKSKKLKFDELRDFLNMESKIDF